MVGVSLRTAENRRVPFRRNGGRMAGRFSRQDNGRRSRQSKQGNYRVATERKTTVLTPVFQPTSVRSEGDRIAPRFEAMFLAAVEAGWKKLDQEAFGRALVDRSLSNAEHEIGYAIVGMERHLERHAPSMYEAAFTGGQGAEEKTLRKAGVIPQLRASESALRTALVGLLTITNPKAIDYANAYSANFVTLVSQETRQGIREVIRSAFTQGIPGNQIYRLLRQVKPAFGLTLQHAKAVGNLREALSVLPKTKKGLLVWAGNTKIRVPYGGLTPELIEKRCAQYSERLLNWRARNIGRTEMLSAANGGQYNAWSDAVSQGYLRPDDCKVWIITPDERLCPVCGALDGEKVYIGDVFSCSQPAPPAHFMCRCTMGLDPGPVTRRHSDNLGGVRNGSPFIPIHTPKEFGQIGSILPSLANLAFPGSIPALTPGGLPTAAPAPKPVAVSPEEAVTAYQNDSLAMNAAIRGGKSLEKWQAVIEGMDQATALHRFEGSYLYRGIPKEFAPKFKVGQFFSDAAFCSTTKDASFAVSFIEESYGEGSAVRLSIRLPSGARGLDMNLFNPENLMGEQAEFVLGRNRRFYVESVRQVNGVKEVEVLLMP